MQKENNVKQSTDIAADVCAFLRGTTYDRLFVLTDSTTLQKCLPRIAKAEPIVGAEIITINSGDQNKNTESLAKIWRELSSKGATRNSIIINLGGGMITDIGGFAAASFKRGIRTINIPTTLMAAVDAAVGGKTGINFNGLKNEIGAFHTPLCVFIDCTFLETLDHDNILSGYAEMIKHALISNAKTFRETIAYDLCKQTDYDALNHMTMQSVTVKQNIVEQDPYEKGIRKALNFGHTVGHAIESLHFSKKQPCLHGHAVAAGIIAELYLSHKHCNLPTEILNKTAAYIKAAYPPLFFDCSNYDYLYERMLHDKKNTYNNINFTLLADVGQIKIDQTVNKQLVYESLDFYRDYLGT